ncbi:transporter substrate-binding domain-containing protein [bacterium]|nr:transporter substrate-binding domain-containing protein [bacterium]
MKRWSLFPALCASALLAGCAMMKGGSSDTSPSPVIDRILQRGELRVGTSGTQPPLSATAKDGSLMGFDIEIANAMANAMGVKLTLVPMDFHDLLPAVQKGDVDMVLSGLTMTPQRNLKVAFVGPYLVSGMSLLTKSKTMSKLRKAEEINTATVKVAALRGSTAEKFAQTHLPKAQMTLVDTLDEGVAQVREGKVEALLADHPFCLVSVYRYRDELATLDTPFTFEPLGIALPPNDPLLVNWTQNELADLDDSGTIYDMMYTWFEEDDWVTRLK